MKRIVRSLVFVFADIISLNMSLFIAYLIRFDFNFETVPILFLSAFLIIAFVNLAIKLLIFTMFRLYKSLWRYAGEYEIFSVAVASLSANVLMTAVLLIEYIITGELKAPRSIFAITMMLDVFAVAGSRLLYRMYRRSVLGTIVQLDKVKRVLIIGAGDGGAIIAREMKHHPELYRKPVAFLDDDRSKFGHKLNGIPVIGNVDRVADTVISKNVQEIIIAIPSAKPAELNRIYAHAAKTGCKIQILPSVSQLIDETVIMQKIKNVDIEDLLGRDTVQLDVSGISVFLQNKRILVTGAGGSIGSELCRQIAAYQPSKLVLLDNYENNLHELSLEMQTRFPSIEVESVIANIRERKRMNDIFLIQQPQVVFHAAAHKHVPLMEHNPAEAIRNNLVGTWNVANAACDAMVERFVLISTDKAVNPTNVMGASKRLAEMVIQAMNAKGGTDFVAVRFGNVLGSNGSVIPLFRKQIAAGGPVTVTHPEVTRFFMTIPEAAQLVLQAGAMAKGGEIFLLDMGNPVRILDLAENMIRLSGYEPHEDIEIKFTGLRPGEKLYEELLLDAEGKQTTSNSKIFIAKPVNVDYDDIVHMVEQFTEQVACTDKPEAIKMLLQQYVSGYHEPKNSNEEI